MEQRISINDNNGPQYAKINLQEHNPKPIWKVGWSFFDNKNSSNISIYFDVSQRIKLKTICSALGNWSSLNHNSKKEEIRSMSDKAI